MRVRKPFEVIYENDAVIVVNKAPHIYCIPPRKGADGTSLSELLTQRYGKLWTVHRIDRNTTGVVLFARNEEIHRRLSLLFQNRDVKKTYLAISKGAPSENHGVIDIPLAITSKGKVRVDRSGKQAQTDYHVVERFEGYSLISLKPTTGRQHQIRVHLKAIGCPLIVDSLYGDEGPFTISEIKRKKLRGRPESTGTILERTPLHAHILELPNGTLDVNTFEAELPKDMRACLAQLRKWRSISYLIR
ncbi:MAG: RNA pseudouridine synthase [Bacteroidetes bacterium]|nr:MAG: RNA pseudouridine synthase [Bacteroidota bacterium]